MCRVFEEIAEEARQEERKKAAFALIDMAKEFGLGDEEIVQRLIQKVEISEEQANQYMSMYNNRVEK